MTDQELIEAYKKGSNDAIAKFLQKYRSYAFGIAWGVLKNSGDVDDCLQDLGVEWMKKSNDKREKMFTNKVNLLGMLARNVKFRAIDMLRRRKDVNYELLEANKLSVPDVYDVFMEELKITQEELHNAIHNLQDKCIELAKLMLVPHKASIIREIMGIDNKEYARLYDKTLRHLKKQLIGVRNSRLN